MDTAAPLPAGCPGRPSHNPIPAADPAVRHGHPVEAKRLSDQCQRILALFLASPERRASNRQLAAVSLKYTSRISDLRRAGFAVEVASRDHASGLVIYQLTGRAA